MTAPLAYWPGDLNPAQFQTLSFNTSNNTLTISPFGNSISITPTSEYISSINSSTITTETLNTSTINSSTITTNTFNSSTITVSTINGSPFPQATQIIPVVFDPAFTPGNTGNVDSNGTITTIASFTSVPGARYRISMNPTFNNNATPAAGDYLNIYGTGGVSPNDTINFITLNLNWTGTGLTPGLTAAYGQAVSGVMVADNTSYTIYGAMNLGSAITTKVRFGNGNPIVVEKLS